MTARDRALAEAVAQLLGSIADTSGLCSRLEAAGGWSRLVAAIRSAADYDAYHSGGRAVELGVG
jgi:hypothetical protein